MQSIQQVIAQRVTEAIQEVAGEQARDEDPQIRRAQDPRFGDYQSNCAMSLARKLGKNPRDIANRIVDHLHIFDVAESPEVAGPGFINFTLKNEFLADQLGMIPAPGDRDRVGVERSTQPETIVIDLSSPNLAKEMHVGHLRPTVIGDTVARILEFQGHQLHRLNHVGDWGTQFGMLVHFLRETAPHTLNDPQNLRLGDLEDFYVRAKTRFDQNPDFARASRSTVVDLQSGNPEVVALWKAFCKESLRHCHEVYDLLGIENLEDRGESFYNDMLPEVVDELLKSGVAVESEGAVCLFPEGFTGREGKPLPLIIRKSDGGYGYATTDLAALKHRIRDMNADRIIYVVGNQQKQHFEMLFAALSHIGWAPPELKTTHLATGMLLREDGAPFRTREGGTVKLHSLLQESIQRSREFLEKGEQDPEKRRGYSPEQMDEMSRVIGIASVKYFELSHNPTTDYRFDWDLMLSLDGNTAPYMLYTYARIQSIGRKSGVEPGELTNAIPIEIEHPSEISLAKQLLGFQEVIDAAAQTLKPNLLTEYLYELSKSFSTFYDRKTGVSVLGAQTPRLRLSRLRLCGLTARTLRCGLGLLGISTLDRM